MLLVMVVYNIGYFNMLEILVMSDDAIFHNICNKKWYFPINENL